MKNIERIIESQYPPRQTNVAWKDLNENTLKFYVDGEWRALKDEDFRQKQADWNQVDNTKADFIKNKPAVIPQIAPITYEELKELRDNSQLTPGMHYRITDYITTTVQENTQSAGHQFDVIVLALDESTLSEEASAIQHEGDTYFANNDLNAWKIWYCLDNDTDRFAWASVAQNSPFSNQPIISVRGHGNGTYIYVRYPSLDTGDTYAWAYSEACDDASISEWIQTCIDSESERLDTSDIIYTATAAPEIGDELDMGGTTVTVVEKSRDEGKGVIYRMIDEWNNDVPYDFKNIQYKKSIEFKIYNTSYGQSYYGEYVLGNESQEISGTTYYKCTRVFKTAGPFSPPEILWTDTQTISASISLYTISGETVSSYSATIFDISSETYTRYVFSCGENYSIDATLSLETNCYSNKIDKYVDSGIQKINNNLFLTTSTTLNCYNNTFGTNCYRNTFSDTCYNNTFCNNCYSNTFGTSCYNNTFGNNCYSSVFSSSCQDNKFDNGCSSNIFGGSCSSNTFGDHCSSNTFGNNCSSNTFGNNCSSNTFSNTCGSNTFSNACLHNTFGTSCNHNTFSINCSYNEFYDSCYYNTFGNNCQNNKFGSNCSSNTFGDSCYYIKFGGSSSRKSYYKYIVVENGNQYIYLNCTGTTSGSNFYQNVTITQGVNNTTSYKTITDSNVGQTYQTVYKPAESQTILV